MQRNGWCKLMDLLGGKYLTFQLVNEEYGLPIKKVKEIIGIMEITLIPKTPDFIKGVINLRGKIIPVMDLRLKFGLEYREYNPRTCIIVIDIELDEVKRQIGIIVDTVSEVVSLHNEDIEPPPQYGAQADEVFLYGLGKDRGKVILLLDIDRVFKSSELVLINEL
jgi:purine-binding chemotaxis protein CheW